MTGVKIQLRGRPRVHASDRERSQASGKRRQERQARAMNALRQVETLHETIHRIHPDGKHPLHGCGALTASDTMNRVIALAASLMMPPEAPTKAKKTAPSVAAPEADQF